MKVIDANVLLYAVNEDAEQHAAAHAWLEGALNGRELLGFSWLVVVGFLRLSTHHAVLPRPLDVDVAGEFARTWVDSRPSVLLSPGVDHLATLTRLASELGGGNSVNDAHLAALAVEHDGEVVTFDRDFGRFEGVRWSTPAPPAS